MQDWPDEVYGFPVRHHRIGTGPALKAPVNVVWHTEEAWSDEAAEGVFVNHPIEASSFALDEDSIIQFRGLNEAGGALRHSQSCPGDSPNMHAVSIEIAACSQVKPWTLKPGTAARLAALTAYVCAYHDIPVRVPNPLWRDDCTDIGTYPTLANNNSRRQWAAVNRRWPEVRGVWSHLEVPWQDPTWHWDCGALNRLELLQAVRDLMEENMDQSTFDTLHAQSHGVSTERLAEMGHGSLGLVDAVDNTPERHLRRKAIYDWLMSRLGGSYAPHVHQTDVGTPQASPAPQGGSYGPG